ncbi:MAG: hypothetical protein ACREQ5_13340 [Candidatus Dormibacteria bacterium]
MIRTSSGPLAELDARRPAVVGEPAALMLADGSLDSAYRDP